MKEGTKCHYIPYKGAPKEAMQNGIVKSKCDDENFYFIVYHWSDEPENYQNYTGARTHIGDVKLNWV